MPNFNLSTGRTVRGDFAIYPNSLLFVSGSYPDKNFSITPEEMAVAAAESGPVPFNLEHSRKGAHKATEGLFGGILRQWIDPDDPTLLRGEVAIPLPLDEKLETKAPSMEFAKDTKKIVGAALTYTPRVSEAALMSAVAEFAVTREFAMARHNTPEGQTGMQGLHDMAARAGAVCDRKNTASMNTASMSSKHESVAIQSIHDIAADHGADCSSGDAPAWAKSTFSRTSTISIPTPTPAKPQAKGETMYDKLKAFFSLTGVPEADLDAHVESAVAEFTTIRPAVPAAPAGMTDAERADFAALKADNARMKADAIRKDAEAFADAAIAARRAYPAERMNLIASFSQAAQDDAAAPATVSFSVGADAKTGSRLDAFRALVTGRPAHGLTSESIETAIFSGGAIIPSSFNSEALDQEKIDAQVKRMLESTTVGMSILAAKNK